MQSHEASAQYRIILLCRSSFKPSTSGKRAKQRKPISAFTFLPEYLIPRRPGPNKRAECIHTHTHLICKKQSARQLPLKSNCGRAQNTCIYGTLWLVLACLARCNYRRVRAERPACVAIEENFPSRARAISYLKMVEGGLRVAGSVI